MRILLVEPGPWFSVQDVANGWEAGFKAAGCDVLRFNLGDRLSFYDTAHRQNLDTGEWMKSIDDEEQVARAAAKGLEAVAFEWWPDLTVIVSGFYVPPFVYRLFRARGLKTCLMFTEEPYEAQRELSRADWADYVTVNDPTHLDAFRQVNPNSWYFPAAYDPDVHKPGPADDRYKSDFCFVGTGYPSRIEFLEQVDWDGLDVCLAGNWQWIGEDSPLRKFLAHDIGACCPNESTIEFYRSTRLSANMYRKEAQDVGLDQGWSIGPREVELAATGTFFLREARPEGDELFPMLPAFESPAHFQSLLRYYHARPELCVDLAAQARLAIADRTFTNHARRLLGLVNQEIST